MNRSNPGPRFRRLAAVILIVARHAFGYAIGLLRIERLVPFHHGLFGHTRRNEPYTRPEHVRLAVEELGVASIETGQILSTRGDLLPPAYQAEFAKLQDSAPPESETTIRTLLIRELGQPIEDIFAVFDARPLAAASIGQAHAAVLPDGSPVIVKVRRPGVVEQVDIDLEILTTIVSRLSRFSRTVRRYDLDGIRSEFAATLRAELDFEREATNMERFAINFANDETIRIPRVHHDLSTKRVLTMERLSGLKVDDLAGLDAVGIDRRRLAQDATTAMLRMIFEHGLFHADPTSRQLLHRANGPHRAHRLRHGGNRRSRNPRRTPCRAPGRREQGEHTDRRRVHRPRHDSRSS